MSQPANNIVELEVEPNATAPITPMMRQYFSIKEAHPEYLLFYRMGDFYELFFEDAITASGALDIALTHRGKLNGKDVPMCGVPHHNGEYYLHKLIKKGFKVAICEQMEDPREAKKRGAKSVVKREVVRIVTSGTLTEDTLLDARSANFLAAIAPGKKNAALALAWLDISTGEFYVCAVNRESLGAELSRVNPKELLVSETLWQDESFAAALGEYRAALAPHAASFFDSTKGARKLKDAYKVASLEGFGALEDAELGACGALLDYVELTQKGNLPRLNPPKRLGMLQFMSIDAASRRNLELERTLSGEFRGSLLSAIDKTVTGTGARLLCSYIGAPLLDPEAIRSRLDRVEFFTMQPQLRRELREALHQLPDMERALSRLYLGQGRASPRDLGAIRDGLRQAMLISGMFEFLADAAVPASLRGCVQGLGTPDALLLELQEALTDNVGVHVRDGGFIRNGYDAKLDDYRQAQHDSQKFKDALREKYSRETTINSLKIKENNILGYFIEVTPQNSDKVPDYFIHRQTMGGALRYTTQELKELEHKIINARGYALELEIEIFQRLVRKVVAQGDAIALCAQSLAMLDVGSALAELATTHNYSRPHVDDSRAFRIRGGRHPVVEALAGDRFIANDCDLSEAQRLWLVTGPNMAGKSTFLRQNALIAVLAQMGSFVPAESAHIGVVDRVFSRVGAADNLARGQSTFMVEMVETAAILNQATDRSLVILDELGRGTATFDGLSIAWAVVEYLHDTLRCRGLFATHYHELTMLRARLPHLACYTMKVKEWKGDVVFLHEIGEGVVDRSYGIHVGRLAGLPQAVLARAEQVMHTLQEGESGSAMTQLSESLPLFAYCHPERAYCHPERSEGSPVAGDPSPKAQDDITIEALLKAVDVDNLTPREALELLYSLRERILS